MPSRQELEAVRESVIDYVLYTSKLRRSTGKLGWSFSRRNGRERMEMDYIIWSFAPNEWTRAAAGDPAASIERHPTFRANARPGTGIGRGCDQRPEASRRTVEGCELAVEDMCKVVEKLLAEGVGSGQ